MASWGSNAVPSNVRSFNAGDVGTAIASGGSSVYNGPIVQGIQKANPWDNKAAKNAEKKSGQYSSELYEKTGAINKGLSEADQKFLDAYNKSSKTYLDRADYLANEYTSKIGLLKNEAQSQAKDAKATYTNSILPEYKNAMQMAKNNAAGAMTLKEASDPNNAVAKGVRDLYEKQAQAARTGGQQDFGVLSALGAQAAQGQFGAAGPMTSGQMGQIYAANQAQAGDAYARAQQRMYDLQQQGLDKGFDQSNQIYQFGQQAQDRYGQSIKDLQGGEDDFYNTQGKFRDEINNYNGANFATNLGINADKYNVNLGANDIAKGNAYAGGGREQNRENTYYGGLQQATNNAAAAAQANQASKAQFLSSLLSSGATLGAAAMSDEREKKKIGRISDDELDEFLSAVEPKTYEYKSDKPGTAPGKRVGFMMQDVQGTKLGDEMTRKGPAGEIMYDRDNLNGIILAALARDAKKRTAA